MITVKIGKFGSLPLILFCMAVVVLAFGLGWVARGAGHALSIRSILISSGLLARPQAQPTSAADKPDRTTLLNELTVTCGYNSYLEIGQGNRQDNFDKVNCRIKIGVDPDRTLNAAYQMTSDEFFALNHDSFALVFIDGLHLAEQAERDVLNSLRALNENGTIVVHDCNPVTKAMQVVPRRQLIWTGDVWKAWAKLRATRADLKMCVVDVDNGCGVIKRGSQELISLPRTLTYETLDYDREKILNLVDFGTFVQELRKVRFSRDQ